MTRSGCVSTGLALVATLMSAAPARAQAEPALSLEWNAPPSCPDRDAVLARVSAQATGASQPVAGFSARADVSEVHGRYHLALRLQQPGAGVAERKLDGDDCAAVADAAALLIALAIAHEEPAAAAGAAENAGAPGDHGGAGGAAPNEPAPSSSVRATSKRGTADAASSTKSPRAREPLIELPEDNEVVTRSRPWRFGFAVAAAFALDAGMLPNAPALGPELRLQLQVESMRLTGGFSLLLARRAKSDDYPAAELDGSGAIGTVALGIELMHKPLVFVPSAVFELGELALEAHGITAPDPAGARWLAAGAALHFGYPVAGGLELALDFAAEFPFAPPRWLLRTAAGPAKVFTTSPAVMRIATGLGYVFQ